MVLLVSSFPLILLLLRLLQASPLPGSDPLTYVEGPGRPPLELAQGQVGLAGWQVRAVIPVEDRNADGWEDLVLTLASEPESVIPKTRTSVRMLSGATLTELGHAEGTGELDLQPGRGIGWVLRQVEAGSGRPASLFALPTLASPARWSLDPETSPVGGPFVTRCVGDFDGDGFEEVAVANAWAVRPLDGGETLDGAVAVLGGAQGRVRWTRRGTSDQGGFGTGLAAAGDRDGDGTPDVAVLTRPLLGGDGESRLQLFSGADGERLTKWEPMDSFRGFDLDAVGDLDGDGLPELRIGENVIASTTNRPLDVCAGARLAWCVPVDDLTGDGIHDLLVGRVERGTAQRHVSLFSADGLVDLLDVPSSSPAWIDPCAALVRSLTTGDWILVLANQGRLGVLYRGQVTEKTRERWSEESPALPLRRIVVARRARRADEGPRSIPAH